MLRGWLFCVFLLCLTDEEQVWLQRAAGGEVFEDSLGEQWFVTVLFSLTCIEFACCVVRAGRGKAPLRKRAPRALASGLTFLKQHHDQDHVHVCF